MRMLAKRLGPAVAALGLMAGLAGRAEAGDVTVSLEFDQYSGAVGNGVGAFFGNEVAQSVMNGSNIAPIEPLPGLEDFFTPPDPNDPTSVAQGIGRGVVPLDGASSVDFYTTFFNPDDGSTRYSVENLISFTPGPAANVGVGQEFLLGTLSIQNGEWWAADAIHRFAFTMTTHSDDPALDGHVFSDTLILDITANGGTPEQNADIYYFEGRPDLGTVRVLEQADGNNFGTVDLYGKIGSLDPTRFGNPTGGAFLVAQSVPEPTTLVMLGLGAVGVIGDSLRRTRRRA